jgi:DNA replication and repair protein RecF
MLSEIRLKNFRSYADYSFEFDPGVNIIVGPNASGKTNLLEAILVVACGTSYRAKDTELVQFNKPWSRLDARLNDNSTRTVKLTPQDHPAKSYELSGKSYTRMTFNHSLPVVLFEPNHLQLIAGRPEQRRNYLDDLLEQTTTGYGKLRRDYKRVVAQRNALLKHSGYDPGQLFPWDVRLSELAGQIVRKRLELVKQIDAELPKLYKELSKSKTKVSLKYSYDEDVDNYESQLLKKLISSTEFDRVRGFTSYGPHRDDLLIFFNSHQAQEMASRGETRTIVLGLKIIEMKIIAKVRGINPILLLDDVFSELDGARRRALTEHLSKYQCFITTTDADIVLHHFTDKCLLIPLNK